MEWNNSFEFQSIAHHPWAHLGIQKSKITVSGDEHGNQQQKHERQNGKGMRKRRRGATRKKTEKRSSNIETESCVCLFVCFFISGLLDCLPHCHCVSAWFAAVSACSAAMLLQHFAEVRWGGAEMQVGLVIRFESKGVSCFCASGGASWADCEHLSSSS